MTSSLASVHALRVALDNATFAAHDNARAEALALASQLEDYILPRLENIDAPLLAVVGGSTGSGKSTLVNAIVGQKVTQPGVIRPTTRQPVLVAHPEDSAWFNSDRVLPGLAREQGEAGANPQATSLRTVACDALPPGLALLDAPDFDSIDDRNRALASQLLAAADLWVFVTTPARYADQLVWNFLNDAASRDIEVVVILNRVDTDAMTTVPEDLRRMMREAGLTDVNLFTVPDAGHIDGQLPQDLVLPIREHLAALAADSAARRAMAAKTVLGALGSVQTRVNALADVREGEEEFGLQLSTAFDANYDRAREQVIAATSDGNLLRNEVLQRWQDFVGTSDAFRTVEKWYSTAIDRVGSFFTGKPAPVREVKAEIETGLHAVVVDSAQTAAARSWSHLGSMAPDLRATLSPDLAAASPEISEAAAQLVREWQAELMHTIENNAADKRKQARLMSLGFNVVTVALMLVVFASTAGLTGGEVAIAGGSAVVGQKMLETIFGEDAVRRMATRARRDLDERISVLFAAERARFDQVTQQFTSGTDAQELRARATSAVTDVANQTKG
ncbi:ABC transporter [Corynebacterium epidermidicanis]|uniref:ABC transporter n=1 Tax=Corynebacterium epidermidicanis TaxID=1050174 RepID=UPI0038B26EE9